MNRYDQLPDGYMVLKVACETFKVHREQVKRAYYAGRVKHEICRISGFKNKICIVSVASFVEWNDTRKKLAQNKGTTNQKAPIKSEISKMLESCKGNLDHPNHAVRNAAREVLNRWETPRHS